MGVCTVVKMLNDVEVLCTAQHPFVKNFKVLCDNPSQVFLSLNHPCAFWVIIAFFLTMIGGSYTEGLVTHLAPHPLPVSGSKYS